MGGRSGGGAGMLRSVGRAVRAAGGGAPDPFSAGPSPFKPTHQKPTSASLRSISSTSSASSDRPISITAAPPAAPTWPSPFPLCDEWDWEPVDALEEDDRAPSGFFEECVFGCPPSRDEVQTALSALQQVFDSSDSEDTRDRSSTLSEDTTDRITSPTTMICRASSVGSDLDWKEPSLKTMLQPHGTPRVYDAFHLLRTEPSVQRMVISLSSDNAVWEAVLNNATVQELRESFDAAGKNNLQSSDERSVSHDSPSPAAHIVGWILGSTKAKLLNLLEKITNLMNPLFQSPNSEKMAGRASAHAFEEWLRSSLLISVVVLLIVVVTRAGRA